MHVMMMISCGMSFIIYLRTLSWYFLAFETQRDNLQNVV